MCSAGLYISIFIWEMLNQRMLDDYFAKCKNEEEALETFGMIYSKFFIEFNAFYEKESRNMMDFNTITVNLLLISKYFEIYLGAIFQRS